jgi:hypothetical protein
MEGWKNMVVQHLLEPFRLKTFNDGGGIGLCRHRLIPYQ